jgi:hypothetical protein
MHRVRWHPDAILIRSSAAEAQPKRLCMLPRVRPNTPSYRKTLTWQQQLLSAGAAAIESGQSRDPNRPDATPGPKMSVGNTWWLVSVGAPQ